LRITGGKAHWTMGETLQAERSVTCA